MRIVVIGAGQVGSNIAASLADNHEIVVIDRDGDRVESLTYSEDVLAIEGDGTSLDVLEEAGVTDADIVIASTDNDETNIVICSTATVVSDAFTIARVRNTEFLKTWQRSDRAFGVDFMVCTDLLTAQAIARIVGLPGARDVDPFAGGQVQMAEFEVTEGSSIAGQTVREADQFDELTFAALLHDDDIEIPTGQSVIEAGWKIVVIGSPRCVRSFAGMVSTDNEQSTDILIIGGGSIGEETARVLSDRGLESRIVEADETRARQLAEDLLDTVVMHHDPTDAEFLEREHIEATDLVVSSLDSDERNLLVALLAKRLGAKRAVAVVENGEYVNLFEAVGIDIAINPREVTAEEITRFTREQRAENVALIESDRAEVLEIEINGDSTLADRPIRESIQDLPDGVVIGAITRDGVFITPRGDTVIKRNDHVVVFVDAEVLDEVMTKL
ncbi:MAG: Trk system potassium transporter TrkA [Halobacteriales archaeon]|nr:Trk system potassium transporter TrkA [Halobacteriales archaeon]